MTGRPISYHIRNLFIKDCKRGVSQRKIAQKYEISKSAVQKLYKKFLDTGTVVDRSGRGINHINILCENLEVLLIQLGLESNFILQQDNDPKHTAKKNKKVFHLPPHKIA